MRPQKLNELIGKGEASDNVVLIIDRLMAYRHQPYSEILKMPVPLVEKIMKEINKQIKQENKMFKK